MLRVTEVLDYFATPWLVAWKVKVGAKEANRISKAAMKIGTRVDEYIKANPYLPKLSKKDEVDLLNPILAYYKWFNVYKPTSIVPQARIVGMLEEVEVSGEPDLLVDDVLVDLKCSSRISPVYWIQVNVYAYLAQRHKVAILRLDKVTGAYEYVIKDYDKSLVLVWLGLARAYLYYKGDGDGLNIQEVGEVEGVA